MPLRPRSSVVLGRDVNSRLIEAVDSTYIGCDMMKKEVNVCSRLTSIHRSNSIHESPSNFIDVSIEPSDWHRKTSIQLQITQHERRGS